MKIIVPDKIQLKNLEKKVYETPVGQMVQFTTDPLLWNKSQQVDFHKFSDRSKMNLSKFDSDQGLASDMIQDMVQGENGNWWLATAGSGLIQYDGKRQHIFTTENGLSSDMIRVLLIDHLGQLWIGSDTGIDIYDGQRLKRLNTSNGLPDNRIWALYEDEKRQVWIGTEKGLVRIDPAHQNLQVFTTKEGLPNQVIWSIYQDRKGQTWIGTEEGLAIMEEHAPGNHIMTTVKQENGLPTDNIWSIDQDGNGDIWMGSNGYGIYQWSQNTNDILMFNSDHGLSSDWIWDIYPTDNGIWFGAYGNGAILYQKKDGEAQFTQLGTDEGLGNNYVLKIVADQQGGIWLGTDGGGVNVLHQPDGVTRHYSEGTGLNEKFVQCVFRDSEGLLWMGTDSRGVNIIDEQSGKVSYLSEKEGLSYNSVWAITEDDRGGIWIGTESGLNVYDKTNHTLTKYDTLSGLCGQAPWTLMKDTSGNIWVGTEDAGLCKFDAQKETFILYKDQGLDNVAVMGFTEDATGNIWVATRGLGLFRISMENEISRYDRDHGLSSDSITYLFFDSKNRIWAATEGHGIDYFQSDTETYSFQNFSTKDGLSNDEVWSVIEDDQNRIWVGTVNKITIINSQSDQLTTVGYISTEQGLKSNDLNPSSVFKEPNGNLIWATIKGPSVINPSRIRPNSDSYSIRITGLEIEHQFVDFRSNRSIQIGDDLIEIASEDLEMQAFSNVPMGLALPHEVTDLRIDFTAQKTYFEKDLQFQYKLSPIDDTWRETQTTSAVILNNLGHGQYNLEIRVKVSGGEWSTPTNFPFSIRTPWWETWIAQVAAVLILLVALYSFYVIRTRSLIKSKEFLENKVKERTYELERSLREVVEARNQLIHSERMASLGMLSSGIAHELSNPISAVYNASQLMERDFEDLFAENGSETEVKENIKMSLEVLKVASGQTREIIMGLTNYSRLESKEMILGDVHQCLDNSIMLIQSKLNDIQIEKDYHPSIPLIKCYYTELTQVFLNLISNAIDAIHDKPENEGLIRINTKIEKRFVKITITDNGVGMSLETSQSIFKNFYTSKEPSHGTGLGLAISQSIVKKHRGSISFETEKGVGTTFTTLFPMESDSLDQIS